MLPAPGLYCDLELDPMTFILELDLDIVVTYLRAKSEVNRSDGSKVIIRTTQTDRQTDASETFTFSLLWAVIRFK